MSDEHGDAKLNEDATFDPNVWYAISEARVDQAGQDFHHNLQFNSDLNPPDFKVFPDENHLYWQIIPIDGEAKNRWHLRSQKTGSKFHLATCINPKEVHPDKTGLCMLQADEDADNQKWEATQWGDGTSGVRFINVGNGTNYWLDCHKGSPPFMSDDIDTAVWQPAQRWLFSSVSAVEEASLQVGDGSPVSSCCSSCNQQMTLLTQLTDHDRRR
ncbi:hypothetical protein IMZ48_42185 [Candidatus Bathyarchaeota archaeon]|nr:hypothetical protein [Candidatus Bathyarchaeota archaeon]